MSVYVPIGSVPRILPEVLAFERIFRLEAVSYTHLMENIADKKGRFIVFEGLDGSGKTTQIDILSERLRSEGRKIYKTAEPTESVTGGLLRDALGAVSYTHLDVYKRQIYTVRIKALVEHKALKHLLAIKNQCAVFTFDLSHAEIA